mgnify:CR=1 FL=1
MKLIYEKANLDHQPGDEVRPGDLVMLSSGEHCRVEAITLPHKPESTGRVTVSWDDGDISSFFPSVLDAKWINRTDR